METLEFIQWLVPYVVLIVGLSISGIVAKNFIVNKFKYAITRQKIQDGKQSELDSLSGKLRFAIEHTDLAYEKINKDIAEAKKLMNTTDKNIKSQAEAKLKGAEQQLQVIEFIMKNKQIFDMGGDLLIPMVGKFEKKLKGMVKGGLSGIS